MQTLSIITFSSDWKLPALLNRNTAKEWNVYPLHPRYKAFRNQLIKPNTMSLHSWYQLHSLVSEHFVEAVGSQWGSYTWRKMLLLSQHLSVTSPHKPCVQDVKQERTFDWDPSMMGQAESWLGSRHCCCPRAGAVAPGDSTLSLWCFLPSSSAFPHFLPSSPPTKTKRLLLWEPTVMWTLPLVSNPGCGTRKTSWTILVLLDTR